jgi:hypothetical protein
MTADLTLVVVGADSRSLLAFELQHITPRDLIMTANGRDASLAAIGNHHLEHARTPVVGLVHADCVFREGALDALTRAAMDGAVCGVVGISREGRQRWACGGTDGPVATLDSCSVFLRRDLGLRFDVETFDGLHCHVEDVCMQAHARNIPVLVPAANCWHIGRSGNAAAWRDEYRPFRARLAQKWPGVMTT